jgi:hypothetical protein
MSNIKREHTKDYGNEEAPDWSPARSDLPGVYINLETPRKSSNFENLQERLIKRYQEIRKERGEN